MTNLPVKAKRPGAGLRRSDVLLRAASRGGEMPLDYMLRVMRDDGAPCDRRDDMAKAAAGYLHPKLQAVEHSGTGKKGEFIVRLSAADLDL